MKKIVLIGIILFCFIASGCSFEPRSKIAFPDELNHIYFSTDKPYSALSNQLNALLRSMNVQLMKQKSNAPFSIVVTNDNFSYSRPDIVDTSLPTNINYSQSATVTIENNKNHTMVVTHTFNTSQSITLNANQIYTANANNIVRQELNRQLTSLIYYWLISSNIKAALYHANHTQTTRHTS